MNRFLIIFSIFLHVFSFISVKCSGVHELYDDLFITNKYNNNLRPVRDIMTIMHVNVSLSLIAIVEFDEVKETLVTAGKLALEWTDEFLMWNPANYSGLKHLHIPQANVWKPYIALENSVVKQTDFGTPSLQVVISNDGMVQWHPVEVFHTTCSVDVRKFPFDTQTCSLILEEFGYTQSEINLHPSSENISFHEYDGSSGWTVTSTHVERISNDHESHIICSITLKRKPFYFVFNTLLPVPMLSLLNTCIFILPVQSGEKASFAVTVFLSLAVLLTIVSSKLPEHSDGFSILNMYVFINTIISTLIAVVTIFQIRIYNRDPAIAVPAWLVRFVKLFTSVKKIGPPTTNNNTKQSFIKTVSASRKSVTSIPLESGKDILAALEPPRCEVGWPDVVKALDNVFLVLFLAINTIILAVVLAEATRK